MPTVWQAKSEKISPKKCGQAEIAHTLFSMQFPRIQSFPTDSSVANRMTVGQHHRPGRCECAWRRPPGRVDRPRLPGADPPRRSPQFLAGNLRGSGQAGGRHASREHPPPPRGPAKLIRLSAAARSDTATAFSRPAGSRTMQQPFLRPRLSHAGLLRLPQSVASLRQLSARTGTVCDMDWDRCPLSSELAVNSDKMQILSISRPG